MNKQLRIIIGDIGDESAANIAAAFAGEGDWAVTRLQRHDKLTAAVRTEHPDVLILNLTAETIHVPVLTEELLRHSELVILVLYNRKNDGLARILTQQGVHYVPCTQDIPELVSYVYRLCGVREAAQETAVSRKDPEYAVTHLLHCFEIPTNLHGFHYLRCAIMNAYRQDYPQRLHNESDLSCRCRAAAQHAFARRAFDPARNHAGLGECRRTERLGVRRLRRTPHDKFGVYLLRRGLAAHRAAAASLRLKPNITGFPAASADLHRRRRSAFSKFFEIGVDKSKKL